MVLNPKIDEIGDFICRFLETKVSFDLADDDDRIDVSYSLAAKLFEKYSKNPLIIIPEDIDPLISQISQIKDSLQSNRTYRDIIDISKVKLNHVLIALQALKTKID